jgi:hypothetical protein
MTSVRELVRAAAEAAWDESAVANDCPNCNLEIAINSYRRQGGKGDPAIVLTITEPEEA